MPGETLNRRAEAKHALITLVEIPALLTTGCCCTLLVGSGGTRSCSKGWGLTSRGTPADKAADGQAKCMEQLPGWGALLHEPMLTQSSSRLDGRQRHSGTELLAPSGLQGPHNRAFSAERKKKKVILLIFCTFCSVSNICAKAVQTDVRVGELMENQ